MLSLLSLLQKEDALLKERETNFNHRINSMYVVDDFHMHGKYGTKTKEDVARLEAEIEASKKREVEIDREVAETRKIIVRYMLKIIEV